MAKQTGQTVIEYLDAKEARIQKYIKQVAAKAPKSHGTKPCMCGAAQIPIGAYKYCPICQEQAKVRERANQVIYRAKNRERDQAYQVEYRRRQKEKARP